MVKKALVVCWTLLKVTIAVLLVGWCSLYLRRFDGYLPVALPAWISTLGLVLAILGGSIVLMCGGILSTRGILKSGDPLFPRESVAWGPFRYVRNPMSLDVITLMGGLGCYERSLFMLLFAGGLFVVLHLIIVRVEEPGLERRFGASYREYKRSVHRWLPKP